MPDGLLPGASLLPNARGGARMPIQSHQHHKNVTHQSALALAPALRLPSPKRKNPGSRKAAGANTPVEREIAFQLWP